MVIRQMADCEDCGAGGSKMVFDSPWVYFTLGGFGLGTAITGGLHAPWPWWLTLAQGSTAAGLFWLGIEVDAENSPEVYDESL